MYLFTPHKENQQQELNGDTRPRREQLPHPDATLMAPALGSNRPIKGRRAAAQLCSYCWDDLLRLTACPSTWVQLDLVLPFVLGFNSIAHPLSYSQQIPQQQLQPLTDLLLACDLTPTDHQPFCQFPSWESPLPSPFVATLCGVQYLMWSYFPLRLE